MTENRVPTVRLDIGDWQQEWFLGGHVALDFVNTVPWRLAPDRTIDRLPDAAALTQWAGAVGLIEADHAEELRAEAETDPAGAGMVAEQARELREQLYRLLQPVAVGQAPEDTEIDAVRRAVTDALGHAEITTVVPLRWTIPVRSMRDLPRVLALSAWQLLQFDDLTRLRQCRGNGCAWLFMDRSKNASRVWCSAADCGNRTRARRHYRRQRDTSTPASRSSSDSTGTQAGQ